MQWILTALTLFILVAACTPTNTANTETASPPGTISSPETDTTVAQTNSVEVRLTDFAIDMPTTLPAGMTTLNIINDGQAPHNLEIEGSGIDTRLETNLAEGETGTLQVDLTPGTYKVYCPVGNHEEQGMVLELTVN